VAASALKVIGKPRGEATNSLFDQKYVKRTGRVTYHPQQPSFLARKTLGHANYFLLALVAAFLIAFIPRGAQRAIDSHSNRAEDWLPKSHTEATELAWFRDHFIGEQFALVSWDGCTLGNTEKLDQLSRKLIPSVEAIAHAADGSDLRERALWYKRIVTGPAVLAELVAPPLSLTYEQAIQRIEGALVGPVQRDARGKSLGDETRTTCLVIYFSPEAIRDNGTMRRAVERISDVATYECAIPRTAIHMGGPPVDNVTIDLEGQRTLPRLAAIAALTGLCICYWCFRSAKITFLVFATGVISAGMSLAIVFYFGIIEVVYFGASRPILGTVDAILMSMPAVAYVLGLSSAIHLVNYYCDARRTTGLVGAAETAIRHGWLPLTLSAVTTAVALGSLITSDIVPIRKFGVFSAVSIVLTLGILLVIVPAFLHRFPLSDSLIGRRDEESHLPDWVLNLFGIVVGRNALACLIWLVVTGVLAVGFTRINTSVQLLELLDERSDLIQDYAWLEGHLGNLVPMELVVTIPPERIRTADEHAEQDGKQYRMTMLERLEMIREIQFRIEAFPEVSRALSAATFAPANTNTGVSTAADRSGDYAINKSLEDHRPTLLTGDYLRMEQVPGSKSYTGRELWRVSARVAGLRNPRNEQLNIDYGLFVEQLRTAVDPVLVAYQQRDMIVDSLHQRGKKLDGAQVCILYRTPDGAPEPTFTTQESVLANLLLKSGVQPKVLADGKRVRGVSFYNLTDFDAHADEPRYLDDAVKALSAQDALILVSAGSDPTAKKFVDGGIAIIDVSVVPVESTTSAIHVASTGNPRSINSVYTGIVPLIYKTQRQLLGNMQNSLMWACLMIGAVMVVLSRSAVGGIVAMLPNIFPIVVIFGMLGWLSIKVDIGIMMSASVAFGVAINNTIHFLTWFRRGVKMGLDRVQSVILAYERCAPAMIQTTLIAGLGLTVFAASTFVPTQQFGCLVISMLTAALVGDLLVLPALLAGPLGYYYGAKAPRMGVARLALPGEFAKATRKLAAQLELGHMPNMLTEIEHAPIADFTIPEPVPVVAEVATAVVPEPIAAVERMPISSNDDRRDLVDGAHVDLHTRLRNLRRDAAERRLSS
jgi:uncharacterized protein